MLSQERLILLIEDNTDLQKINQIALEMSGFRVISAFTLEEGFHMVEDFLPDLIVLDIMMPDGSGIDFCRELRSKYKIPILFLSALGKNTDIIAGLSAGGDDYLSKPYDLDVLVAKIEALLRRVYLDIGETYYIHQDFKIDFLNRCTYYLSDEIILKPKEYEVLAFLVKNREHFISTPEIYHSVWNYASDVDIRTVKTHIYNLRKKLSVYPDLPFSIEWSKGKGYRYIEL